MSKFIRWLDAFGDTNNRMAFADYCASLDWELNQRDREVAVEPLWKGKSLIAWTKLGLEVDTSSSLFVRGWLKDAHSLIDNHGRLTKHRKRSNKHLKSFKCMDRFLAAWNKYGPERRSWGLLWGEATFDLPVYTRLVCKDRSSLDLALQLGARYNLEVRLLNQ
jgi:hypothetical protein